MERAVRRVTEYISRFYHRQWQWWELLALGLMVLLLLLLVVRVRRKTEKKRPEELAPGEQSRHFRDL